MPLSMAWGALTHAKNLGKIPGIFGNVLFLRKYETLPDSEGAFSGSVKKTPMGL